MFCVLGKYKWNFTDNSDLLQNLVTSIMDLVVFYHCQDDAPASFIGTSLVKNSLLALNHILTDAQHVDVKIFNIHYPTK